MQTVDQSTTRTAAEDDGIDQIGSDTPRSGIATPQPDPHDKRLPGIMSYFGQVRQDPSTAVPPSSLDAWQHNAQATSQTPQIALTAAHDATATADAPAADGDDQAPSPASEGIQMLPPPLPQAAAPPSSSSSLSISAPSDASAVAHPPVPVAAKSGPTQHLTTNIHPYPTPPPSQPCSSASSAIHVLSSRSQESAPAGRSASLAANAMGALQQLPLPTRGVHSLDESRAQPSHAHDTTLSNSSNSASTTSSTTQTASKWFSLDGLKELTRSIIFKSGPPTPTRALSTARPSLSDGKDTVYRASNDGAETSGTQTPRSTGAQVPAARGKLTVKVSEARGLRKCHDPYVVAVFQRSELISGGPRPSEDEEPLNVAQAAIGGIPIQRSASDSGRPMAIPMRSRQSSNTSITDYNTFRNRNGRQASLTHPKWDAEAVFDVVDSGSLVDVSIYDHTPSGEKFLGHVKFEAPREKETLVRGWFPLKGHVNTVDEDAPTGEVYVEALYQRTEKKHYGPSDFEILKLIGKGTFGQVYQVRKRDTQRIYAMKVLQKKVIVQKKEVAHTVGERNILVRTATSDSPFIVGLKFSFQTPSELYLVTDYMSGGELFWHLQKEGRFDERRAKFYIAELILAIQHLHNNDIVYRDLKPENILLDANGHIALCDFGLSKANLTKNDTTNTFCGTTEYLAPEVLLDESGYTKMVDFWSLGVLVFEMCCGWSPFYAEDTQQMYKNIAFGKVRFPRDTLSQEGRNFVKGLLNRNPKHRLGATDDAEELKQHPFFNDIDWTLLTQKRIAPPFKPKLKSETDVSYFDPEFTTALDQNGSLNERAAALARGYAASTPLSPSVQANFQGFTFVDESALDDHMRDRVHPDDEEMDDAGHHTNGNDFDDWDNIDDFDVRQGNRMSGIVRTSTHDEQMVGGHFDD
ncbi:serine/threonine-protein kinase sck1 [Cordyceps fumosorosea ARSEF 2679]|uniref:non-specific serine/threonine protein kinase n=1 Tax=Cordyceps fumosorosea (strain ARSEF 2679) TaxID=1081104 RepID=A0A162LNI3_CORFA|nr:serine/threonine-protein kinase sck1 [Cordyceps fumosorosea ARSEF 2679]OAA73304.1 serine/threonine-protein kinase sck1 [Cordyceps fumosorosea ARSEF 2679]